MHSDSSVETSRRHLPASAVNATPILIGAAVALSLAMGIRQSLGLFLGPITEDLGLSTADFTFALAVQNVVWGISQPLCAMAADRWGYRPMMVGGAVCYSAGLAATALASGLFEVMLGAGILIGIALSCTAASLTMSATARVVPEARRSVMLGIVSATGSIGAFVAAPLAQQLIGSAGWRAALFAFFGLSLAMIVATFIAGRVDRVDAGPSSGGASFGAVLRFAARDPAYLVMSGAYFVCGLQLVFLTTHLPSYLRICGMDPMLSAEALAVIGLFNIAGSYGAGWLGQRYPKHVLLGLLYVLRSFAIAVYFSQAPTPFTTLVFAAAMGSLWLSVVPLMSGLVAQMYGVRFMATLIGISFMNHQIGSFLGAWGGGLIFDAFGSYDRAWQAAAIIGTIAGLAQMGFGAPRQGTGREALAPA